MFFFSSGVEFLLYFYTPSDFFLSHFPSAVTTQIVKFIYPCDFDIFLSKSTFYSVSFANNYSFYLRIVNSLLTMISMINLYMNCSSYLSQSAVNTVSSGYHMLLKLQSLITILVGVLFLFASSRCFPNIYTKAKSNFATSHLAQKG